MIVRSPIRRGRIDMRGGMNSRVRMLAIPVQRDDRFTKREIRIGRLQQRHVVGLRLVRHDDRRRLGRFELLGVLRIGQKRDLPGRGAVERSDRCDLDRPVAADKLRVDAFGQFVQSHGVEIYWIAA